ncbi:MAG: hypothetical protein M1840_005532 [Geoglossum simile]|nr:MAG: hypothetical protein M1840_005532 [Geoglossum simile]
MADPLSISASIIALLQLSATVIKYLSDVKDAPDDIKKLRAEVISTAGLLYTLKALSEAGEAWLTTIQSLNTPSGPLEQIRLSLERLAGKLRPAPGLKKILGWPFQKGEVKDTVCVIERQKALFGLALQNDHLQLSKAIKADIAEMGNEVREAAKGVAELQKGQKDEENRDITAWLSTLRFSSQQNAFFGRRQEGTGQWLLETDMFKKWVDGTERTLWCPGLPGAGKTILASVVVDYLERSFNEDTVAIAYIYCSYKGQEDQTVVNLIASLLQQLVQRNPVISEKVISLYRSHTQRQSRPTLGEYSSLLQSEICRFSKVFIVIDALDECPEDKGVRESFLAEIHKLQPSIYLFVTSRHISTIERMFEEAAHVEIRASDKDVRMYLEGRIKREGRLARNVRADPSLKEKIIYTIVEKAKGMFLLAQLHTDSLVTKATRKDIRKALETLPKELDGTYEEAMRRIESQNDDDKQLAEQILSWISYALKPLTLKELQHALAVEPGEPALDEDNLPDEELLTSVCAGLVTIDRESNIIRLVHYTTQEYFERIRAIRFPDAQTSIAKTCLAYISFDAFAEGPCVTNQEIEARMHEHPLLEYAARHWGDHALGEPDEIVELALEFLEHNSKLMCSYQVACFRGHRYYSYSQRFRRYLTGLHIVASMGLANIARRLLQRDGADPDPKDSGGRTPLSWAAQCGHEAVVKLLLGVGGVDPDFKDSYGRTPLLLAAQSGHEAVVELLLSFGVVDPDSKDSYGRTPLSWAAQYGHEAMVKLLLSVEGVDPESKDISRQTPLSLAAEEGHEAVVKLLLDVEGVDPNSKDSIGQTILSLAARNGNKALVKLLLGVEGIDSNSKDISGRTPLSWAAEQGCEAVVRLLLNAEGVDLVSKDSSDQTILSWAAEKGHESVVKLLLGFEGVDPESKDSRGRTPLSLAAQYGHEAVVKLLLGMEGVSPDSKDSSSRTPLSWAAEAGQAVVVALLLNVQGVDPDFKDICYRAPLSWAAEYNREAVVELLLKHGGVDPDPKDSSGRTPLSRAAERGHGAVVKLLLDAAGVDPDSKDTSSRTPLSWAADFGREAVVELLLKRGSVDPNHKDCYFKTPLSYATHYNFGAVVQLLAPLTSDR